jgi:hypothetical protein
LTWNTTGDTDYESKSSSPTKWWFPASDLSPGATRVEITAVDIKGLESKPVTVETSDTRAPKTQIRSRVGKRTAQRTVRFRLRADESPVHFACKIDARSWRACNHRFATYRLRPGRHRFMARATDGTGNTDPTPAVHRFLIRTRG